MYKCYLRTTEMFHNCVSGCLHNLSLTLITNTYLFFQMPRNVFEEMKYIELMIVSDHSMVCVCVVVG